MGSDHGDRPRSAGAPPVGRGHERQFDAHRADPHRRPYRLGAQILAVVHRRRGAGRDGRAVRPAAAAEPAERAEHVRGLGIVLGAAVLAWLALAGPAMLLGGAGPEVTVPALLVC